MRLKFLYPLYLFILFVPLIAEAASFKDESLRYIISYKWGIIHKDAGEAILNLKENGNVYNITLTAKTKPWADKLYKVRDTLKTTMRVSDLRPTYYTKRTHEKGEFKIDEITFTHKGNETTGVAKRHRNKDGRWNTTEKTFSATGPVFDMVSVFYYLRQLDYSGLDPNKVYKATIFSGKMKESVNIRNLGIEEIKLKDKTKRKAFHVKFNFTKEGGKKSSDDMDIWISTDSRHIPLYLTASLPVGEVRAYYTGP